MRVGTFLENNISQISLIIVCTVLVINGSNIRAQKKIITTQNNIIHSYEEMLLIAIEDRTDPTAVKIRESIARIRGVDK